jgi:hypothetical protein
MSRPAPDFRRFLTLPLPVLIAFLAVVGGTLPAPARVAGVQHVDVIGVDGLGGRTGFLATNAPALHGLMKRGAWTLHARGVMPTSSSPNWASMLMGAGPEQHGVTSNDWLTNRFDFPPTVLGAGCMFPTIFTVLREKRSRFEMGAIYDWSDFGRLFDRAAVNVSENVKGSTNTARRAIQYFREKHPDFLFIHFDDVDHAGHEFGWGSPQYLAMVETIDGLVGDILAGIEAEGLTRRTLVLVTADHGGFGTKHGGNTLTELEIPWIVAGPGVAKGHELEKPINTYDTAATLAWVFGVKPADCWLGRPVREAFR